MHWSTKLTALTLQSGKNYVTYTITDTNNGPSNATGVAVTDKLPTGLTYVSSNPSTGTYNSSTGVWTIGNLNDNQTVTLTVTAQITATSGTIINTAKETQNESDRNLDNNAQTTYLTVSGSYTPSVEMAVIIMSGIIWMLSRSMKYTYASG